MPGCGLGDQPQAQPIIPLSLEGNFAGVRLKDSQSNQKEPTCSQFNGFARCFMSHREFWEGGMAVRRVQLG